MASEVQVEILKQGAEAWDAWCKANPDINVFGRADLAGANLRGANLAGANLALANLCDADLAGANFIGADLRSAYVRLADLSGADLTGANLTGIDLRQTNLIGANFRKADLTRAQIEQAEFKGTDLSGANLTEAYFNGTTLVDLDLSSCIGLATCRHSGPSIIDHRTLQRSESLPLTFLRGVGLPNSLIDFLPSLRNQPAQFYSCFISHSAKDEVFANQLYADLQAKDVRCWFAPEDMRIGAKILDTLDEAIRLHDKLLLVLSEASISSDWVEDEVTKAFAEERSRGVDVLFPIRLDNKAFETSEAWASKLRNSLHIGDFRNWTDPNTYQKAFDRLLRDLRVKTA